MMTNRELHVVLGAGQIGPKVAEMLQARGHQVRIVRKRASPSRATGIETASVDLRDPAAVARVVEGATVVYACATPLYHQWSELLLPMTRGIVEGISGSGARLVALDNLYMYGDTTRMSETSPVGPVSKKGLVRKQAAECMLEADARGALPVAICRAADFFGPETPQSVLGESFFRRVLAGKSAQVFGDPDELHTYSFTPDVAAGLVAIGARTDTRGIWMLPVQPAESTRAVIGRFAHALGREVPVARVPSWLLRAIGLFQPMVREVAEMTYQWRQPFVVDDAKFRATFGFGATPWGDAIARTLAWGQATYGSATRSNAA